MSPLENSSSDNTVAQWASGNVWQRQELSAAIGSTSQSFPWLREKSTLTTLSTPQKAGKHYSWLVMESVVGAWTEQGQGVRLGVRQPWQLFSGLQNSNWKRPRLAEDHCQPEGWVNKRISDKGCFLPLP